MKRWKDKLGIAASGLCAVHCAAMPILLSTLPSLSLTGWMASPLFHQLVALLCLLLVLMAIVPSVRRTGDWGLAGIALTGVALLLLSAFVLPDGCGAIHQDTSQGSTTSSVIALKWASIDGAMGGLLSTLQPWLTPCGGMLLICAHILNQSLRPSVSTCGNKGCRCGTGEVLHMATESSPELRAIRPTLTVLSPEPSELELQRAC